MLFSFCTFRAWPKSILSCCLLLLIWQASSLAVYGQAGDAKAKQSKNAVLKGKIAFSDKVGKAVSGEELKIPLSEMTARLREYVDLPAPKLPSGFDQWTQAQRAKWEQDFVKSEAGKKHIENNKKLLEAAHSFDIKIDDDGTFTIYDVPVGEYGIQGRVDKLIGNVNYAFEVFGQLKVQKDVDELVLAPIQVEVTPLLKQGDVAPAISVKTHDNKATLERSTFKEKVLFVNFWSVVSPSSPAEQKMVQEAYSALKDKYEIRLLSINVDSDRKKAIKFLLDHKLQEGSHGFTDGMDHPTPVGFGARGVPSFWLIENEGKILMSQYEFAQAMRVKPDMAKVISDRIEGKDAPTLAPKPAEKTDEK